MSQASNGKDLFTFMAYGARVSIFIGVFAAIVAGGIALSLALLTAYYRGLLDLVAVLTSDAFSAMPQLLVLIMLVSVLADHWISSIYSGGFLIAFLFGIWGWMGLWRAVRGPAFQVAQNEWVLASKGFGERPWNIVRKHVAPYVIGYLLIYLSMSVGGYMIGARQASHTWGSASKRRPRDGARDCARPVTHHHAVLAHLGRAGAGHHRPGARVQRAR